MNQIKERLQTTCRSALRPLVQTARRMLTPPEKPLEFTWQEITDGPAAGTQALLPDGRPISELITGGRYEAEVMSYVRALVADGDVCFDIGGHYGAYTFALAKLTPSGSVHTFEPVHTHADRLRQSIERSRLTNTTIHELAVADQAGEMSLSIADGQGSDDSMAYLDAYGGVDTPAAHEHYQTFVRTTVRATTLDCLMSELPAPAFIKVDAEGAEVAILRAGLQLIRTAKPRLLVELHGINEALGCAELLDSVDYCAILLTDQKVTMPVLWASRDDVAARQAVRDVLGREPTVLFDGSGDATA